MADEFELWEVYVVSETSDLYRDPVAFLNARISYLRGSTRGMPPPTPVTAEAVFAPGTRYEFEIRGIGREDKQAPTPPSDPRLWRLQFGDFLAGAYTYRVPISYRISSTVAGGLSLSMGTWSRDRGDDETCVRRTDVLRSLLSVLYPHVGTTSSHRFQSASGPPATIGGLVQGHPTAKAPVNGDNVLPIDRLIRACGGREWSVSILASPEPDSVPERLREALIAELSFAEDAEKATRHELPVVKQFTELVEPTLRALLDATTLGAWRTAVYLEADPDTYPLLGSVWRSVYSAERSTPETVHVMDLEGQQAQQLASDWAFPRRINESGATEYRHPFEYQTLLNSTQLAAYIHLPSLEVPGFWVDVIPRFDVSGVDVDDPGTHIALGTVVARASGSHDRESVAISAAPKGPPFSVSIPALSRHVFIAGVTGSGKTNTSLRLLRGLHAKQVPFLVIEPAKREYRELAVGTISDPASQRLGRELTVFTAASDEGTPLQINPFEVEVGTTVAEHIDLLRAVFAASFGDMWTPLPQVLEQCMLRVYRDRGWDLLSNQNYRLAEGEDRALAFPTLRELSDTVDEIVGHLGFDPEARDRVRGSLATRVNGLRVGSKGALFDTRNSLSMASLLDGPAILELERLADESDKAFLIGLLLIRLVEYRRGQRRAAGPGGAHGDTLRHMLVIEEAHRLLANVNSSSGSDNTARAQAVESFSNLLAEIRAYGQGIVVIDQVPTKLASDVIKNTNLKIAHRIVDEADRKVLGGSMSMSAGQMAALASLARGEAAVFGDGDDSPILVHMTGPPAASSPSGLTNADRSRSTRPSIHWGCACTGDDYAAVECVAAGSLVEQTEIRHGILRIATAALLARNVDELSTSEVVEALRREGTGHNREELLIGCLAARGAEWLADVWGARRSWSFRLTLEFAESLRRLLVDALDTRSLGREATFAADSLLVYQQLSVPLHIRTIDPYPSCGAICVRDLAGSCLYRHAVASTLQRPDVFSAWSDARSKDGTVIDGYPMTWNTCSTTIASEVLGPHDQPQARRAVALCFAQQAVAAESPAWPPWLRTQLVDDLVAAAAQQPTVYDDPREPERAGAETQPTERFAS
jgi:hypothetical protein